MTSTTEIIVTPDERTMGTLAHVLQLVGGWLGPLVIFFVKRDSKFVSFHALQVLLLHIIYAAVWMLVIVTLIVTMVGTMASHGGALPHEFPATFFIFIPVIWLVGMAGWVVFLILAIVYGVKANRGEWARYPVVGNWAARILKIEIAA